MGRLCATRPGVRAKWLEVGRWRVVPHAQFTSRAPSPILPVLHDACCEEVTVLLALPRSLSFDFFPSRITVHYSHVSLFACQKVMKHCWKEERFMSFVKLKWCLGLLPQEEVPADLSVGTW